MSVHAPPIQVFTLADPGVHAASEFAFTLGRSRCSRGSGTRTRYIAHAVGPVWQGGERGEDALLTSCYRNALMLAVERDAKTIAFPSISTGAFRFPIERAARIAQTTVRDFLKENATISRATFCMFDHADERVYRKVARILLEPV
jgi:O-acetyl-ADP-ribose deacetylase